LQHLFNAAVSNDVPWVHFLPDKSTFSVMYSAVWSAGYIMQCAVIRLATSRNWSVY